MRVLLRADASPVQGTGHVMRCLTLGEELLARGHEVALMTGGLATNWLEDYVSTTGIDVLECAADGIDEEAIVAFRPDWVVVDSYRFPAASVTALGRVLNVLAIVDGDHRGIEAAIYLDQNLGAESIPRPEAIRDRFLCGAPFALVRRAILDARRAEPWRDSVGPPTVLTFMGGTDATGANRAIAESLRAINEACAIAMVAPVAQHPALRAAFDSRPGVTLVEPTASLPAMMGRAQVIVSATGTSAWDICSLGVPAVLVAVVDNQRESLGAAIARGLVLGVDCVDCVDPADMARFLGPLVARLLRETDLRRRLSETCLALYDGRGTVRVVEAMEMRRGVGPEGRG